MRICFELLELLKAHKKAIRRATVNTFGYIAKAIGLVFPLEKKKKVEKKSDPPKVVFSEDETLIFSNLQTSRCIGYAAKQLESTRTSESCMYHGGYCYRGRNMFSFHCFTRFNERVPGARIECTKWCIEVVIILVRIHRRNG